MSAIKVQVSQGIVRGCEEKLPDGGTYLRFSGIPYAKPPTNELRFRSPQKLLKFHRDEIDCTKERDACFHKSTLSREYVGSEDCLNLNVYVPKQESSEKLAVMVYIHGGAMKYDSNSKELYSPEYLLMENVIVVTINYRLHVLGFMTLPSLGISGNAGLKDQQIALEWIHENIASFNGDPNNICLFGESAGAVCVHLHMLNAKSRKFFHSAICQSGTAFHEVNYQNQSEKNVMSLAKELGCVSDSIEDAFKTLLKASAKDLYEKSDKGLSPADQQAGIRNLWRVVIEEPSEDSFLSKPPVELFKIQAGQIKIPIMIGSNNGDGMPIVARIIARKKLDALNENFKVLMPRSLRGVPENKLEKFADEAKRFYFGDRVVSMENVKDLVTLVGDINFLTPQAITMELNAKYIPDCKQFVYEFQFNGRLNLLKKQMKLDQVPFATHADELFYIFGGTLADKVQLEESSRENKMRKIMCKLWSNFAKFGDPTPEEDNPLPFKWTPVNASYGREPKIDCLVINDDLKMVKNLNKNRIDFWRDLISKRNLKDSTRVASKL